MEVLNKKLQVQTENSITESDKILIELKKEMDDLKRLIVGRYA